LNIKVIKVKGQGHMGFCVSCVPAVWTMPGFTKCRSLDGAT